MMEQAREQAEAISLSKQITDRGWDFYFENYHFTLTPPDHMIKRYNLHETVSIRGFVNLGEAVSFIYGMEKMEFWNTNK